jgi:serine/threonine protein kinase
MGIASSRQTFCKNRREETQYQRVLDDYIFSGQYDPEDVQQDMDNPFQVKIIGYNFTIQKEIGSGSHGKIYLLQDTINDCSLAIKFSDSNDEVLISNQLNQQLPSCNALKVKAIGKQLYNPILKKNEDYGYFMELAEGTLYDFLNLFQKIQPHIVKDKDQLRDAFLDIAEKVRLQMICIYLMNKNYVYTDLKSTNVLYKCKDVTKLNQVSFILGDLGSAVPSTGSNKYSSTYPPIEYTNNKGIFKLPTEKDKEETMSWELGILLLSFIASDRPEYKFLTYNRLIGLQPEEFATLQAIMVDMYWD